MTGKDRKRVVSLVFLLDPRVTFIINPGSFKRTMCIPRPIRIAVLLFIFFLVAANAWLVKLRATDWDRPLWVVIYPVNGDGAAQTTQYMAGVDRNVFTPIEQFMNREAAHYDVALTEPFHVEVAPVVKEIPPRPPAIRSMLRMGWWSLRFRYWAWRVDQYAGPVADLKMFVVFWDPVQHQMVDNSFGLEKGLVGVMNGFATMRMASRNNVVIAHELLHLLGAADKYDYTTLLPLYPAGFAEPELRPLYPQQQAEIMAGRIPVSATELLMPANLHETIIGPETAREIKWLQ